MKNKDLINKIKESSNNVEVPNLKESIILQTKNLKIEPEEKHLPKKTGVRISPRWRLAFICVTMILLISIAAGNIIVTNNRNKVNLQANDGTIIEVAFDNLNIEDEMFGDIVINKGISRITKANRNILFHKIFCSTSCDGRRKIRAKHQGIALLIKKFIQLLGGSCSDFLTKYIEKFKEPEIFVTLSEQDKSELKKHFGSLYPFRQTAFNNFIYKLKSFSVGGFYNCFIC